MNKPMTSLVDAIHKAYPVLTGRERRVADFVLAAPGEVSAYGASELARMVGVSPSTVTRFVQRIDFARYEEMRRTAREARNWGSPLFIAQQADDAGSGINGDSLRRFFDQETSLLQATLAGLDPAQLDEITTALNEARNLGFMGFRNSYYFAAYMRWQFIQFRADTRVIPRSGETLAERIADLGAGDVVVVVGIRRIVGVMKRQLETIADTGADVVLITDPSARILPSVARWTINCQIENPDVFDSYSAVLAVIRLLAFQTFLKSGNAGRRYMQQIEARHEELAEFE